MNSFELNKIAGACLGTLLFTMWLGMISGAIFSHHRLAKPGYAASFRAEMAEGGSGATAPPVADGHV